MEIKTEATAEATTEAPIETTTVPATVFPENDSYEDPFEDYQCGVDVKNLNHIDVGKVVLEEKCGIIVRNETTKFWHWTEDLYIMKCLTPRYIIVPLYRFYSYCYILVPVLSKSIMSKNNLKIPSKIGGINCFVKCVG